MENIDRHAYPNNVNNDEGNKQRVQIHFFHKG